MQRLILDPKLLRDYELENVQGKPVFKTEREGKIRTGFDINQLEQIRAPVNDCFRIVNNASR